MMPRMKKVVLLAATAFAVLPSAAAVNAGWENIDPHRREFPPVKVVWTAPCDGFGVLKEDGAEGDVTVAGGVIRISKTNAKGRITVSAPAFGADKGKALRLFADVASCSETAMEARGYLCAYGERRLIASTDRIGSKWFAGGGEYMRKMVNSAPGMTYRKYTHFLPESGTVTPVIVVEGLPSESAWRNWAAEDLDAAQAKWDEHWKSIASPDRRADLADLDTFEAGIAADIDHTAQIVVKDGTSRFVVDGRETPPVVYKAPGCEWDIRDRITYSGKPLQRAGVRVGVLNLRLGNLPTMEGPWSEKGFDLKGAVDIIRNEMRIGDESVFILALGTSAYRKFTEEHPDETWRREDGSVVRGNSGSAIPDEYNDGGKPDPGDLRWPWVSYCSPAWRGAIKGIVAELVAELKRTGLSKRIVGVHFYGYHDGQFAVPVADHSGCAKAEYSRYLAEHGLDGGDPGFEYAFFMKQIGFRALEDFSRAAKKEFGKPIIAVRWCMLPFNGNAAASYDIGSFVRSDAVDVIVPQPTYTQRLPALAQGVRLPCASLHRHGKMMWFELDLRTYAALEGWAQSVVATKGLGQSDDLCMWKTVFRKHVGIMTAQRMGWWLYDMAGGWFYPSEIVDDIGEVFVFCRELGKTRPHPWHPDLALVVDETALASYGRKDGPKVPDGPTLVMLQWPRTALAGVPYDFLLADDLYASPEIAGRYKAISLCAFNAPDSRQKALMDKIAAYGVKTFVVQPGGYSPEFLNRFAREAGCYVATRPGGVQVDMNGDFVSVHCINPGQYDFMLPFPAKVMNVKSGLEEKAPGGVLPLELSAGETCWFRLYRR